MTARLASLLAAAALCGVASPALAQEWHGGPPLPPQVPRPVLNDGHVPMPVAPRVELHQEGVSPDGHGPGMIMPPPPPGSPGPAIGYGYPSPYPGWVYPPVAWVKVPIVHERSCGCQEVVEEEVVTHVAPQRVIHRRHEAGKWVRSTK